MERGKGNKKLLNYLNVIYNFHWKKNIFNKSPGMLFVFELCIYSCIRSSLGDRGQPRVN